MIYDSLREATESGEKQFYWVEILDDTPFGNKSDDLITTDGHEAVRRASFVWGEKRNGLVDICIHTVEKREDEYLIVESWSVKGAREARKHLGKKVR